MFGLRAKGEPWNRLALYTSLSIVVVDVQGNQISALSLFLAQVLFIHSCRGNQQAIQRGSAAVLLVNRSAEDSLSFL